MAGSRLGETQAGALRKAFRQRYPSASQARYAPMPTEGRRPPVPPAPPGGAPYESQRLVQTLPRPPFAVRALNNLSYGVTTASLAEFLALGADDRARMTAYVDQQLNPAAIDDSAVDARLTAAGYTTLGKPLTQLWAEHVVADPAYDVRMRPAWETQRAAFVRATFSRRQLFEVVANFWHDHFNVTASDFSAGPVFVHYDRDVIRPHAFGNFRQMLEAVAQSTSMLYYLDNLSNTRSGPNENFARELLELHTLGAENYLGFVDPFAVPPCPEDPTYPIGYTDMDVYETAAAFTGWTAKNGHWQYPSENDGTFVYRAPWHDSGPKFVLGRFLNAEQPALKDGRDILDRLASHPRVASFVCKKLIRRFLADDPPADLIASAAVVFRQNWQQPDQIRQTLRHILLSDFAFQSWGAKMRRPFEAVVAATRCLGSDFTLRVGHNKSNEVMWRMGATGHTPYEWPAPNGYPDRRSAWSGTSSISMTWKLLNWLTETSEASVPLAPVLDATRAGVPQWTARQLVDFWCQRVLGYLPTAARRQVLVAFLAQNGDPDTYVITDTDAWAAGDPKRHYNHQRLRSMVSLVLMSPEFLAR
jgi:uncharacterized protein (DUF1800 family)